MGKLNNHLILTNDYLVSVAGRAVGMILKVFTELFLFYRV